MAFHVHASGHGLSMKSSTRYNLDEAEVLDQFVQPWDAGESIVVGGQVFDPLDCRVRVREGPALEPEVVNSMTAWITATETSVDVTDRFITAAPGNSAQRGDTTIEVDPRHVAVIHGRDGAAVAALFETLRALDLRPLEWTELVRATGSGAPANRTIIDHLFSLAQAVVVLLTPDEEARLHPELVPEPDVHGDGAWACQPRPNVFLEAGMALAFHPERTIFAQVGAIRTPSDLAGVNTVRLDGSAPPLHELASRLSTAGCAVDTAGSDWLATGRWAALQARQRLPRT